MKNLDVFEYLWGPLSVFANGLICRIAGSGSPLNKVIMQRN